MRTKKTARLDGVQARWLIVLALAVVVVTSLLPTPITFNVRARTQVVEFQPGPSHRSEWRIQNARMRIGRGSANERFSGTLRVLPGSDVVFTRVTGGALSIWIRSDTSEKIAELQAGKSDQWRPVNDRLLLIVPAKSLTGADYGASVYPLSGKITLGADIPEHISEQPQLLVDGSVTMLSHVLVGEGKYEAGRSLLETGDKLVVAGDHEAYGFILAGSGPDMTALCRMVGRELRINRFGAQGYTISASLLSRIKHDPLVQLVWAASIFVVGFLIRWVK